MTYYLRYTVQLGRGSAELEAALLSLPLTRQPSTRGSEVHAAATIGRWLAKTAEVDFTSSLAEDESLLGALLGAAEGEEGPAEERLVPILEYRIQRKKLWRVLQQVLHAHEEYHAAQA
eukprot:CAMPEP_0181209222 /NCGR_PEP_ID=MMETSP1096-20121128/22545_1 /TAXON_ID=156174 ORGANISM="Chrysochromulina ericina, Strain CCMP281" /NCGR_SAMPLE_ID=MMETSP1096 /ASSEMBLY_ACC=CAM_ASM_000453 /LENGTH=117 /DNA_ID=CAMNT_0023300357 /DNA_START=779 /DNA_END=1133 /DNA_ORIENTATION=-